MIRAVKLAPCMLAVAFGAAACGSQGSQAGGSHSPASSASPLATASSSTPASPVALTGAFGVLVVGRSGVDNYTVSLVGIDGKVVGSAQATSPTAVTCADAGAAVLPPPISTSNSRVYFMDAQGVIRFLTPQGETGRATTVPASGGRRSMFAVSPDDQRIAVIVSDFTSSGAAIKLYVEDLNGGTNHVDIYSQSGAFSLWPIGWHGPNNLVVAKVPACTQGGGPFSAAPLELHVVDPATAVRRFTIGGPTCVLVGPPSPAGAVCELTTFAQANVVGWTATTVRSIAIKGPTPAYLSPDGSVVALTQLSTGTTVLDGVGRTLNLPACGWIDSTHVFAGGDAQQQPRVGNIINGAVVHVAAQGACAGRLPGGL
jgi:hypothetical protein